MNKLKRKKVKIVIVVAILTFFLSLVLGPGAYILGAGLIIAVGKAKKI